MFESVTKKKYIYFDIPNSKSTHAETFFPTIKLQLILSLYVAILHNVD